jgi:hypothetical protein
LAGRVTALLASLAASVALVACHERPVAPPVDAAASITFSLPQTNLVIGDSVLASWKVEDANGVVLDSAPVVWSTTNSSIATVSFYGEVYAKGKGIAGVIARSGSAVDTVKVTVEIPAIISLDSVTPHQLIVGQPATLYGHNFSAIPTATVITIGIDSLMPTVADSTQMTFLLPDTSCSPAGTRTITVNSRGSTAQLQALFAPGEPPVALAVGGVQIVNASTVGCLQFAANANPATYILIVGDVTSTLDAGFGFTMTQSVGDSLPLGYHGYSHVIRRARKPLRVRAAKRPVPLRVSAKQNAVGDAVTYNVPVGGCDSSVVTHGHVMAVGVHSIIAQDDSASGDGLAATDFASIAAQVDASIYPTDTLHFGSPSDIDGNGRVILYYTPQVLGITSGDPAIVGGFFFRGDLFPTSSCASSNQGEILYLSTPSSSVPAATLLLETPGTIAHVLEHLINAGNHIKTNAAAFEDPWLDEALAHAAEDFVGRDVLGYTDEQDLTYADIDANPNAFIAYFGPNAQRYATWLAAPYNVGGADTTADTSQAARGASWTLLRYAFDQYAGGSPVTLSRALAAGPATGIYNFVTATGAPLDSLIEGWLVASYATGDTVTGVAPKYTFTSYNWLSVETGVTGSFAIATTPFAAGSSGLADSVQANGGFYFTIANPAATSAFSIQVLNSLGTAITLPGARLYILRTQ